MVTTTSTCYLFTFLLETKQYQHLYLIIAISQLIVMLTTKMANNVVDDTLNASQILHMALQKMDGIISGKLFLLFECAQLLFSSLLQLTLIPTVTKRIMFYLMKA